MFFLTIARTEATVLSLWFSKNNKSVINTRNPKHKTAGRPSSWVLNGLSGFRVCSSWSLMDTSICLTLLNQLLQEGGKAWSILLGPALMWCTCMCVCVCVCMCACVCVWCLVVVIKGSYHRALPGTHKSTSCCTFSCCVPVRVSVCVRQCVCWFAGLLTSLMCQKI